MLLWAFALLVATLLPGNDLPEVTVKLNDKLIHTVMYLVLTVLFLYAGWCDGFLGIKRSNVIPIGIVASSVMAVGTEFLQSFIPGRNLSFYDMLANSLGIILGLGLFRLTRHWFN